MNPSMNLSPRAQKALRLARNEALLANQKHVNTIHLLLGVFELALATDADPLHDVVIKLETLHAQVRAQCSVGSAKTLSSSEAVMVTAQVAELRGAIDNAIEAQDFERAAQLRETHVKAKAELERLMAAEGLSHNLPLTEDAERTLEEAALEAKDHSYLSPEHIVLAMLRSKEGPVARACMESDINVEILRVSVLTALLRSIIPRRTRHPSIAAVMAGFDEVLTHLEEDLAAAVPGKTDDNAGLRRQEYLKKQSDLRALIKSVMEESNRRKRPRS
jgi:ATP-dependent Clp protease ATP-binding subunit ClpA